MSARRGSAAVVAPGALVRLYVDLPQVGCGFRDFLVIARGRKLAKLLQPACCRQVTVTLGELDGAERRPLPRGLARRIRKNRKERESFGLPVSKAGVKAALAILKTTPRPAASRAEGKLCGRELGGEHRVPRGGRRFESAPPAPSLSGELHG